MLAAMGLAGLILFYLLGSRALDTGSGWQYFGCLILLIFSIKTFAGIFKK